MFFLQVSFNFHFNLEMIDHCIPDIFLNERIVYENMVLLFGKTTTTRCKSKFLIYTLVRSTPYPFSKYNYILLTLLDPRLIGLQDINIGCCLHSNMDYCY
jgi:hypothetical protein